MKINMEFQQFDNFVFVLVTTNCVRVHFKECPLYDLDILTLLHLA